MSGAGNMIYITYREGQDEEEFRVFYDITIYGNETEALRSAVKEGKKFVEVPVHMMGYSFLWIIAENNKSIPAWRSSQD